MKMLTMIATIAAPSFAGIAHAQQLQPAGVTRRHFSALAADDGAQSASQASDPGMPMLVRTLTAGLGVVGGAMIGAKVAHANEPHPCGCEGPTSREIAGIAIGGVAGATLGAAIPWFRSECSTQARFGRALAGSVLGFAAGFVFFPIGPLILAPAGSAFALASC